MGWHKLRHETKGSEQWKAAKMTDLYGYSAIVEKPANVLANRWFQPLTHVSERAVPRVSVFSCQRGKREKRDTHRFAVAQSVAQSVRPSFPRPLP